MHNLAIYYRMTDHQGIHTNNYTESWHRILKTSYLPQPDHLQIEEVVQILVEKVESQYHWAHLQVEAGFAGQTTNKFQMRSKAAAKAFSAADMDLLSIYLFQVQHLYIINSFTNP
ncbi:hypothetical protein PCANC_11620 [Puccinia coronata f. sp. avenae]|uniref:MULE transposase domain-containing protein n=1 Tax=Puccinia coronata f. sp. avenae TaxID=200324 RepID=A0A2N5SVH8_9BASI|nr:hypothetical protein PCANC_11620 [Puccinia coronata f. sp. avenae]